MSEKKPVVLFLCTANSARSQMAEALLGKHAGDRFEVHSAGLEPKEIHPLTREVMQEAGCDLSGQRAKGVDEYLGRLDVRYLITVCSSAASHCPRVWPGSPAMQRLDWSVDDPAAAEGDEQQKLDAFRRARDELEAKISDWLK